LWKEWGVAGLALVFAERKPANERTADFAERSKLLAIEVVWCKKKAGTSEDLHHQKRHCGAED
jgi:hypothetical protein